MTYDEKQLEVVNAYGGYHLVLAPPGCGKTEVLAERIMRAHDKGIDYKDMLCLTFTNRASRGMKDRIDLLNTCDGIDELFVGNVHRFCSQFIFANNIVPENSTVIDEDDSISVISDFLGHDEMSVLASTPFRHFYSTIVNFQHLMYQYAADYPRTLMLHSDAVDYRALRAICNELNCAYSRQSILYIYNNIDNYYNNPDLHFDEAMRQMATIMYAAHHYELYKKENGMLDFEDLLLFTYDNISNDKTSEYHHYKWIQIDEVQDLNPLQIVIIDQFTTKEDFTVMYLGDNQQAIFSFMGAKIDNLNFLKNRCGEENIHNLYLNYRSPKYLLDIFNCYGETILHIDPHFLPKTNNDSEHQNDFLMILESCTLDHEYYDIANFTHYLKDNNPEEDTAIIVSSNNDADEVSVRLTDLGLPHFKVSGSDLFSVPYVKMLFAHFNILGNEHNMIAWSRIFKVLRVVPTNSSARKVMQELVDRAMTPTDFLFYDESTYINDFVHNYENTEIVIFDTETTGVDVYKDDVIQIAAIKIKNGEIVTGSEFNIYIKTDMEIPLMLGKINNPIIEEMKANECFNHEDALKRFASYIGNDVLLGHNVNFDKNILLNNCSRYCPSLCEKLLSMKYFDSLKLIKLLRPKLKSYKLKSLLETLRLQGSNSHLANDDIIATKSLVDYCHVNSLDKLKSQNDYILNHKQMIDRFINIYKDLFMHSFNLLYKETDKCMFVDELEYVYKYLLEMRRVANIDKLHYITDYIRQDVISDDEHYLMEQIQKHIMDINTLKEADLCGSKSMKEKIFISTVHKAKGLEFDNVIVFDATDNKYPNYFSQNDKEKLFEETRRFYVAMSRAKRRLYISFCRAAANRYGKLMPRKISPFMEPISKFFSHSILSDK
jgi:DNA helicase-2/ATP-dependent DNA helicase PcrA